MKARFLSLLIAAVGLPGLSPLLPVAPLAHAAEATMTGPELAGRLAGLRQGSTYIRMRMETGKSVLQIQVKERRSKGSTPGARAP